MGFRGLQTEKAICAEAVWACSDCSLHPELRKVWKHPGRGALSALDERINSRPVSGCAHYKPIFPRVSHKSRRALALNEEWNWKQAGVWVCGWSHSAAEVSHPIAAVDLTCSLQQKQLRFEKKIKYVKPFSEDRLWDQSKNQLWKTTTIILLLRYFNIFNLKVILAQKLSHPQLDQCHT